MCFLSESMLILNAQIGGGLLAGAALLGKLLLSPTLKLVSSVTPRRWLRDVQASSERRGRCTWLYILMVLSINGLTLPHRKRLMYGRCKTGSMRHKHAPRHSTSKARRVQSPGSWRMVNTSLLALLWQERTAAINSTSLGRSKM